MVGVEDDDMKLLVEWGQEWGQWEHYIMLEGGDNGSITSCWKVGTWEHYIMLEGEDNESITSCWKVGTMGALHHAGRWGDNKGDGGHIGNALVWEEGSLVK